MIIIIERIRAKILSTPRKKKKTPYSAEQESDLFKVQSYIVTRQIVHSYCLHNRNKNLRWSILQSAIELTKLLTQFIINFFFHHFFHTIFILNL